MALLGQEFDPSTIPRPRSNLDVALDLARVGVHVFPCRQDKRPQYGLPWRTVSTTDDRRIHEWWIKYPDALVGIDLAKSGLLVVDGDLKPDGTDGVAIFQSLANGCLTATPMVRSAGGGMHWYFRNWNEHGNSSGSLPYGIDVRGHGGYVISPGCVLEDGRSYELVQGDILEPSEAPEWLRELLASPRVAEAGIPATVLPMASEPVTDARKRAYGQAGLEAEARNVATAARGTGNNTLNDAAFSCGQLVGGGCLTEGEVRTALAAAAEASEHARRNGRRSVHATISSGLRAGILQPRGPSEDWDPDSELGAEVAANLTRAVTQADPETAPSYLIEPAPFVWHDPSGLPQRQWIYGGHYIRRFLSLTLAPGGVGKSSLTMAEALAMAVCDDLLGVQPTCQAKVWLWNGEDPIDELQRRMTAAILRYKCDLIASQESLFINSGRTTEIIIAEEDRKTGTKIAVPIVEAVKAAIIRHGIDVMIIDPFISSHRVSENDNNAIQRVAKTWADIAEDTNCAIELVHHVRKSSGGEATVDDGRGASALLAAVRSARVLNAMTEDEASLASVTRRRSYFRVDNGKSNLAPPPEGSHWYHLAGVPLMNGPLGTDGDSVAVVERWHWPNPAKDIGEQDVARVQAAVAQKLNCRASSRSADWVGNVVADVLRIDLEDPQGKAKVNSMVKTWIKRGTLKIVERSDANRIMRDFVEIGNKVCISRDVSIDAD